MPGEATLRLAHLLTADAFRSGQDIAADLGCSRAAIWKQVQALRALGIDVEASPGRGYRLATPLELLDHAAVLSNCDESVRGRLAGLEILQQCDSTNAELLRRPAGSRHGQAILAEVQSSGRGRRGRHWHSPFGRNIYLSLGWRFERGLRALSCLPLVVALAASRAIHDAGLRTQKVKWPNDLVLDGHKLGGCLVEIQGDVNGPCLAVMGVGINVFMVGDAGVNDIGQPWSDLGSQLPAVSRNRLAGRVISELLTGLQRFEAKGFAPFLRQWRRLDALAGQHVNLLQGRDRISGIARGIGDQGGLLLESGGRLTEYQAGEVSSC